MSTSGAHQWLMQNAQHRYTNSNVETLIQRYSDEQAANLHHAYDALYLAAGEVCKSPSEVNVAQLQKIVFELTETRVTNV